MFKSVLGPLLVISSFFGTVVGGFFFSKLISCINVAINGVEKHIIIKCYRFPRNQQENNLKITVLCTFCTQTTQMNRHVSSS